MTLKASVAGVIFTALSTLLHVLLFKTTINVNKPEKRREIIHEVLSETKERKFKAGISAKQLSLAGKGIRVGAYRIDPDAIQALEEGSRITELGTENAVTDGKKGRWAVPIGSLKHSGVSKKLYDWIDSSLYYPREFIENKIEGKIEAVLYFDNEGNYLREKSHYKSSSIYLNTWLKKHLKKLFLTPLSFPIGEKDLRVAASFEFYLTLPIVLGTFQKENEQSKSKSFINSDKYHQPRGLEKMISAGKLFFHRQASKNYGLGLTGIEGQPAVIPALDVLGLIDRVQRALGVSEDKKHEQFRLQFLRDDQEWGKD